MAVEVKFKVENLAGRIIEDAGYVVLDNERETLAKGLGRVDEEGYISIPIKDGYARVGEKVRPTVDDFNGANYDETGTATDWVAVTEVYEDFSVVKKGYYVECRSRTFSTTPWDMGDGNIVDKEDHTYLYRKNGTYTITNSDFSFTVTITGVSVFDVEVNGGEVTCTPQSGFDGAWNLGDGGVISSSKSFVYKYKKNGTYLVTFSEFSKEIVIDYFVEGLLSSLTLNTAVLAPDDAGGVEWAYGDGLNGVSNIHQYSHHGEVLLGYGPSHLYVNIPAFIMPKPVFNISSTYDAPNVLTFTCPDQGDVSFKIKGEIFTGGQITYTFDEASLEDITVYLTDVAGNKGSFTKQFSVSMPNKDPVISDIEFSSDLLELTFTALVTDDVGEALSYQWVSSDGHESTDEFPVMEFSKEGDFTISVTVSDDRGGSSSFVKTINVSSSYAYGPELVPDWEFTSGTLDSKWFDNGSQEVEFVNYEGRDVLSLKTIAGPSANIVLKLTGLNAGKTHRMVGVMKSAAFDKYSPEGSGFSITSGSTGILFKSSGRIYNDNAPLIVDRNGAFETFEFDFVAPDSVLDIIVTIGRQGGEYNGQTYETSQAWLDSLSLKEEL